MSSSEANSSNIAVETKLPKLPPPPFQDSPVTKNESSKNNLQPQDAQSRYMRLGDELRDWCVGPMPVSQFLDAFLPDQPRGMPSPVKAFKDVPSAPTDGKEVHEPLVKAFNYASKKASRCPGVRFVNTSNLPEHPSKFGSPKICAYESSSLGLVERDDTKIPAHFGYMLLFVEVKANHDFFLDPPEGADPKEHPFILDHIGDENTLKKAKRALGQNVAYAIDICKRQHRSFCFSISVSGSRIRFLRWDRAGVIVSRSFDCHTQPKLLCQFLWRFGRATDVQRGFDTTIFPTSEAQEMLFKSVVTAHVKKELELDGDKLEEAVSRHYQAERVLRVKVYADEHTHRDFLISRPIILPESMASRGTRGYWAVDAKTGKIAFLKDVWRTAVFGMNREGSIIRYLKGKKVRNIPEVLFHGDVPDSDVGDEVTADNDVEMQDIVEEDPDNADDKNDTPGTPNEDEAKGEWDGWEGDVSRATDAQCTRTQEYLHATWACIPEDREMKVTPHVHYRLALKEVGYGLEEFNGTHELLLCTQDAYFAILDAKRLADTLHRDISMNNIILVRCADGRRRGILIDWELSCKTSNDGKARDHWRSGTWAFMSVKALGRSFDFRHSIQDDLESIIYVVFYGGLRYLPHNTSMLLSDFMNNFFNQRDKLPDDGTVMGGVGKAANKNSRYYSRFVVFKTASLQKWLDGAFDLLDFESEEQWEDIDSLGKLWALALSDENLPTADRVVHEIPRNIVTEALDDATTISTRVPSAQVAETNHVQSRRKRKAADLHISGRDGPNSKRMKASAAIDKQPGRRAEQIRPSGPSKGATFRNTRATTRLRKRSETHVVAVPNVSRAVLPPSEIPARVRTHCMRTRSLKQSPNDTPVQ
ncbi:hypothetical protein DFH11DRAFT_659358 [Phellopilus nigrolimitatus]|nr:hypothetical protein DFH11DRAFT_659358 [Phellopilus nigrolimitatus]